MNGKTLLSLITGLPKKKICLVCQKFTGTMPINFSRNFLNSVIENDYILLEKSDGTRYIFCTQPSKNWFIDRNFLIKNLPDANFYGKKFKEIRGYCFLDGELSTNLILEKFEFLIYDVLTWDNDWRIASWDLISRINSMRFLIDPEKNKSPGFYFLVRKDIFSKTNILGLFNKIHPNKFSVDHIYFNFNRQDNIICNKNDGIILSPLKSIYLIKDPFSVFKWKFENGNTIDFLISSMFQDRREQNSRKISIEFFCKNEKNELLKIRKTRKPFFRLNSVGNNNNYKRVEEYFLHRETKKWFKIKSRKDKKRPNSNKLAFDTLENISGMFFWNELIDKIIKKDLRKKRGKPLDNMLENLLS